MGWHCQVCKHWIVDDKYRVCTYCGTPRGSYSTPRSSHLSSSSVSYVGSKKSSSADKNAIKIIIAIIILSVIGLGFAYANNHNIFSELIGSLTSIKAQSNANVTSLSNNSSNIEKPENVSIPNLIKNSSLYLNETVTTNGLLIQMNAVDQVPGSYDLFDAQSQAIQVVLPVGVVFKNKTNYTITGIVQLYHVPPAQWNGYTNNYLDYYINGSAPVKPSATTTIVTPPSTVSVESSGVLEFCINRMVFRTSDSRGLNESQIQELVNYCEYYGYAPGISNGTNYTVICQGVKSCQGS